MGRQLKPKYAKVKYGSLTQIYRDDFPENVSTNPYTGERAVFRWPGLRNDHEGFVLAVQCEDADGRPVYAAFTSLKRMKSLRETLDSYINKIEGNKGAK